MNVIDFFNFIESKRPKYKTTDAIVNYKSNGFSTPLESSTVNPETYEMRGWFTNNHLNDKFNNAVKYNRYFEGENEVTRYTVVVDLTSAHGKAFLETVYQYCDAPSVIRRFKMMSKIESKTEDVEPHLYEKPYNDIEELTYVHFRNDESRRFFANFLVDVFYELNDEDIKWIENNVEKGVSEAIDTRDVEWLCEIVHNTYNNRDFKQPWQLVRLQYYLEKLFGSVAEYQVDEANMFFDGDGGNIEEVNINWPYAHLEINVEDLQENERDYNKLIEPEWDSSVHFYDTGDLSDGLKFNIIKKYIEMYPFKLD